MLVRNFVCVITLNTNSLWHYTSAPDQIRSDIGLLRVDKRNSTIENDTRNNVE